MDGLYAGTVQFSGQRTPQDLNHLDFWFWGYADAEILRQQPTTIAQVMQIVENFIAGINEVTVRRASLDVKNRAQSCIAQKGGHFEMLFDKAVSMHCIVYIQ